MGTEDPEPELKFEGYLTKQAKMKLKTPKKYWFVLKNNTLNYFKTSSDLSDENIQGTVDFTQVQSVRKLASHADGLTFQITLKGGKIYTLVGESSDVVTDWVKMLHKAMQLKPGHARASVTWHDLPNMTPEQVRKSLSIERSSSTDSSSPLPSVSSMSSRGTSLASNLSMDSEGSSLYMEVGDPAARASGTSQISSTSSSSMELEDGVYEKIGASKDSASSLSSPSPTSSASPPPLPSYPPPLSPAKSAQGTPPTSPARLNTSKKAPPVKPARPPPPPPRAAETALSTESADTFTESADTYTESDDTYTECADTCTESADMYSCIDEGGQKGEKTTENEEEFPDYDDIPGAEDTYTTIGESKAEEDYAEVGAPGNGTAVEQEADEGMVDNIYYEGASNAGENGMEQVIDDIFNGITYNRASELYPVKNGKSEEETKDLYARVNKSRRSWSNDILTPPLPHTSIEGKTFAFDEIRDMLGDMGIGEDAIEDLTPDWMDDGPSAIDQLKDFVENLQGDQPKETVENGD
ncbi:uncharacterized protein [Branchiostoma lanceolatum]|uniref:uncharacterized protein n=1 Tax=Branchiostoma lanceolatum TaxID=7740 RepID=UPI003454D40F